MAYTGKTLSTKLYDVFTKEEAVQNSTPAAVSDKDNTSTGAFDLPSGTTTQRPANANVGMVRYNTSFGYIEQYTSSGWQVIAASPTITTVSPASYDGESGTTFTITGSNFDNSAVVSFTTSGGASYNAGSTTVNNTSSITATTPQDFSIADEPLSVKVTNGTGLSYVLAEAIDCGGAPSWTTASGSLGTVNRYGTTTFNVAATDPDGQSVTYSLVSGSLPTGYSLNTSTGAITGTYTASVGSNTTFSFTIRASDGINTSDRSFSITGNNSVIEAVFNSASSLQTWTKPSGVTSVTAYVWGAGGAGAHGSNSGKNGGGSGGFSQAVIDVSSVSALYVASGQAGQYRTSSSQYVGGAGGGLSGIFTGSSPSQGNAVLIAGGGGGGHNNTSGNSGGWGGGYGGGANQSGGRGGRDARTGTAVEGQGGTLSAGGAKGIDVNNAYTDPEATAGSALQGGDAGGTSAATETYSTYAYLGGGRGVIPNSNNYWQGGGGGGGYFGGGGGACGYGGGGGGGSGYANGSYCSSVVGYTGNNGVPDGGGSANAAGTNSPYYADNAGRGGDGDSDTAGNGRVVITY